MGAKLDKFIRAKMVAFQDDITSKTAGKGVASITIKLDLEGCSPSHFECPLEQLATQLRAVTNIGQLMNWKYSFNAKAGGNNGSAAPRHGQSSAFYLCVLLLIGGAAGLLCFFLSGDISDEPYHQKEPY